MIEISVSVRCERCDEEAPARMRIEGWEHFWCDIPSGWIEELRERRKGDMITKVRMHFCQSCAKLFKELEA